LGRESTLGRVGGKVGDRERHSAREKMGAGEKVGDREKVGVGDEVGDWGVADI
jgi:hypothetical protein